MKDIYYPTVQDVYDIHDEIIEVSGGLSGVNNGGLIDSAIYQAQNDDYYPDLPLKIAHIIYSINKGHAFLDGNKRSSLAIGALMMLKNGWQAEIVDLYTKQMEDVVVWVAGNIINKNDLEIFIGLFFVRYVHDFILKGDDGGIFQSIIENYEKNQSVLNFWEAEIQSSYKLAIMNPTDKDKKTLREIKHKLRLIKKSEEILTTPYN